MPVGRTRAGGGAVDLDAAAATYANTEKDAGDELYTPKFHLFSSMFDDGHPVMCRPGVPLTLHDPVAQQSA